MIMQKKGKGDQTESFFTYRLSPFSRKDMEKYCLCYGETCKGSIYISGLLFIDLIVVKC